VTLEDLGVNPAEGSPASDMTSPDVTPPSSSGQDVTPQSSSGDTDTGPSSLLDVVKNVVEPEGEKPAEPETPADEPSTSETANDDAGQEASADPTPEELARYSTNAQERIRGLIRERNTWKEQVEALKGPAEHFQTLSNYLETNRLTAEDTNLGLELMASLRRGDLQTFLDGVRPYVTAAEQALGLTLPEDLASQVDQGLLPEDTARELARTKAERDRLAARIQEAETQRTAQGVQAQAIEIRSAVASWEADIKSRDPDFAAKQDAMRRFAQSIVAERGLPRSPQQAREFAELAYSEVNKLFAVARPKPTATRPSPNGGQTATSSAAPEPKSLLEAVQIGLNKTRGGF
jgi:hypothetical protein